MTSGNTYGSSIPVMILAGSPPILAIWPVLEQGHLICDQLTDVAVNAIWSRLKTSSILSIYGNHKCREPLGWSQSAHRK